MSRSGKWWLTAALVVGIGVLIWTRPDGKPVSVVSEKSPPPVRTKAPQPAFEKERGSGDAAARKRIRDDWDELVTWLDSNPAPTEDEIRARLLATRMAWAELDPQVLAEMIRELLASGGDKATGLAFKIGPHGFLSGWPTLRVFLLDVLAAADPEMAAAIAKGLLGETASAEEFAVALRSLTREGRGRAKNEELTAYLGQMLDRQEWGNSAGFAEVLDLARLIGSPEAARQLAEWEGNPTLRSMALDEFAAEHPEVALAMADAVDGIARANLMARVHPDDPAQMMAVDAYLHSPDLTAEEADAFLKSFPLRSATTGYRLYGKTPAPYSYDQVVAGDRAALERVDHWVSDPALAKYRANLISLQQRLTNWTQQTR
ncbi:MAG: hypothetical protein ABIT37_20300 [Luteolibacter sp.]